MIWKPIFLTGGILFGVAGLILVWHSQFDVSTGERKSLEEPTSSEDQYSALSAASSEYGEVNAVVRDKRLAYSTLIDGGRVGIFIKNFENDEVKPVFDFSPLDSISPEYSVTMSHDGKRFAYVDKEGLHLRDISDGKDVLLIQKKTGYGFYYNKEARWSADGMDGVEGIEQPGFSFDGRLLMFEQKRKDGFECGVLEIGSDNSKVHTVTMEDGSPMSCFGSYWSPTSGFLVKSEYDVDSANGLFISDGTNIGKMIDVRGSLGHPTADFYETSIHPDEKRVAVLYKEDYGSDDNILAIYDKSDGSLKTVSDAGEKVDVFFNVNGSEILYVKMEENRSLLVARSVDTGEKKYSVLLPDQDNIWSGFQWIGDNLLFFVGDSVNETTSQSEEKSSAFVIDLSRKEIVHSSVVSDKPVRVLGVVGS